MIKCECGGSWKDDKEHVAYRGEIVLKCEKCGEYYFNAQEHFTKEELKEITNPKYEGKKQC